PELGYSQGKTGLTVASHIGQQPEEVVSLRRVAVLGDGLLELLRRLIEVSRFMIGAAEIDVNAGGVSQPDSHLVKQHDRAIQIVDLEVGNAQQIPDVKAGSGNYRRFQLFLGCLVVSLFEEHTA